MVIHLKHSVELAKAQELASKIGATHFFDGKKHVIVTSSKVKEVPELLADYVEDHFVMETDIQLASRDYRSEKRGIKSLGIGPGKTAIIAGPCSVESYEQLDTVAQFLIKSGVKLLRGGCFKPRTSPYTFQGLGLEGLELLAQMREKYGLKIVTEVKDSSHIADVIAHADVVQIGAKAMYDHSILRACGQSNKPVLLKRGFGTTLQEFVQAAEFILSQGNSEVMLCERGIRTFENKTRFTLDLTGVAFLKHHTNLPVIVDPSHAIGYRYGVPDLTRAAMAMGVEGLLLETHPKPEQALSDAAQQLSLEEFEKLHQSLHPVATAVGQQII
ncbi:3-deoxy-7-phosphoheptulonate synthase [Marinoscillum furvescens]|uniref:3-deoxy-D-arabinoheptulosonate-7-phosphate synthase n=1 Tax=Marinoscillum furvescens DSM 4134 TaxID=1122208 RepID=A0A3D9L3I7_MARFU|nr:3-deoxy-7-phosphoheptulonate synthase [Marinoscillum furvescens]RED99854.1 3-deoxy-D-arabinoheptulosonate-7-phosphate synthase [Marinoscillum furvescens DSM 4134]